ncbi:hypothetical protein BH688_04865 [Kushneria phosphatilytica]|nr:hypothetical protein BH688_04865 [Kushneria phosphatilytica]
MTNISQTATAASPLSHQRSAVITDPADVSSSATVINTEKEKTTKANPTGQTLDEAIGQLNQTLHRFGVEFEIDGDIERVITRVIDRESGKQIRQIPAEDVVKILHRLANQPAAAESGLLFSEMV